LCRLTEINGHCDEDNERKPSIEHRKKVNYGDDDVDDRRHNCEHDVVKQIVDAVGAAVNHTQHFAGLATEMPTQRQAVEMCKQTYLH